jgi:DNA-binding beta-propeller fold protein YncE
MFNEARFMSVDDAGNIYVAEFDVDGPGRVQRFDAQGRFVSQWRVVDPALIGDMAADRNGQLYILQGNAINRYDGPTGAALGPLDLAASTDTIRAIAPAPDNGLLAVSRTQLLRFDPSGQLTLAVEDTLEAALDASINLSYAAMDAQGNAYVLSTFEFAVYKFDPTGTFLTSFGAEGDGAGLFRSSPKAVVVDRRGRSYIDDFDGIEVFEPSGASRGLIPVFGAIFAMDVSEQDELLVLDRNGATLTKYALTP